MIYTSDTNQLLDKLDELILIIMNSKEMDDFILSRINLHLSKEVALLQQDFKKNKVKFDSIQSYGKHSPDFLKFQKDLYASKRRLDMNKSVSDYRVFEMDLQIILDKICEEISSCFSNNTTGSSGSFVSQFGKCGGNCHK